MHLFDCNFGYVSSISFTWSTAEVSILMKTLLLLRTSQADDVFSMNVEVNDCGRQNEIIRRGSVMAMGDF